MYNRGLERGTDLSRSSRGVKGLDWQRSTRTRLGLVLWFVICAWPFLAGRTGTAAAVQGACTAIVSAAVHSHPNEERRDTGNHLVVLVDSQGFRFDSPRRLLDSLLERTLLGKNRGVGHSWIVLESEGMVLEGGHTGEYGFRQPKYFESVAAAMQREDPDPLSYLWEEMEDGRFEPGSGGHVPTAACRFPLSDEQFAAAMTAVDEYDYARFAIVGGLCTDFISHVASAAGIELGHELDMEIPPEIEYRRRTLHLWTDPAYSSITFGLPDILELSLMEAMDKGLCQDATAAYRQRD